MIFIQYFLEILGWYFYPKFYWNRNVVLSQSLGYLWIRWTIDSPKKFIQAFAIIKTHFSSPRKLNLFDICYVLPLLHFNTFMSKFVSSYKLTSANRGNDCQSNRWITKMPQRYHMISMKKKSIHPSQTKQDTCGAAKTFNPF